MADEADVNALFDEARDSMEKTIEHFRKELKKVRKGYDNYLRYSGLGLQMAGVILAVVWQGFPFFAITLLAALQSIPDELYEAAAIDGAGAWHRFRFITWPSMSTLYVTCTLLSMIFTVGDFNSVYLLTGGGPADLTHVLATLGIRYLRLDQVGLAMASIVSALPLVLPLVYFMMKRLSR